jgi:hypothetical protein
MGCKNVRGERLSDAADFREAIMRLVGRSFLTVLCVLALESLPTGLAAGQSKDIATTPALTIYNQQFAVVRHGLLLDLKSGQNHVELTDITGHLEPDSVMLRSLDENRSLGILEQNYRNDPVSEQLLLSLYEGRTIDFLLPDKSMVQGKIVRSGFVPHATVMYSQRYYQTQAAYLQQGAGQPVIEVNGKLQFTLPGQPLFPALANDTVLKPTLSWELEADKAGKANAEISYVTGGLNWDASYNLVAPTKGTELELAGWVTLDNQSGKTFRDARVKLMAGDVNKVQANELYRLQSAEAVAIDGRMGGAPVSEKTFDEYHLYTLERPTTLHDGETKQVEFVRAAGVKSRTVYVYDGWKADPNYRSSPLENIRTQEAFGTQSNAKVWVMQEFKNSSENHLGMPLPKGRVRFYRRDDDGQLEFTGENEIDHTPKDELIRIYTGNAFDLTGERRRVDYKVNINAHWVDESFQIRVRNHKSTPVEVRVVEHLYRWSTWDISKNSDPFTKVDAQTVAFPVQIPPDSEKLLTYQVHYAW